jgi:uncharacterized protein YqjF (DUF2071 family)
MVAVQTPHTIDRISPTLAPEAQPLMHQSWRHLLFLHWEVPAMELQALLPPGLDLDTFDGIAYVGLIPFTLHGVRPVGIPAMPGLSSFHEVNVRTYVHRNGKDPGVWFFSLDASSMLAVTAARAAYHLPYFNASIDFSASDEPLPTVGFQSRRDDTRGAMPANAHIRYRPVEGVTQPARPGTIEHFLIERYILYAADEGKRLYKARVHHQPYPIQRAEVLELDETLVWSAGVKRPQEPAMRHYASGVDVNVYGVEKV